MSANPLVKHFRQPTLYAKVPSNGQYWPEGSIDMPTNGELPIYPMTTRDEITIRTPDALINGNSVTSIIESCCPSVKNAWQMPSVDVDALLIAIRIASYGNEMTITATCPHCNESNEYVMDLHNSLRKITMPDYSNLVEIDGLKIKLKPQPYYSVNKVNLTRFSEQKMLDQLRNSEISEIERLEEFRKQMQKLVDLNTEVIADSTEYVQLEDNTVVNNRDHILEFYNNCDAKITKRLQDRFAELNAQVNAKPEKINCGNVECRKEFESTMDFDYSSFFVEGF